MSDTRVAQGEQCVQVNIGASRGWVTFGGDVLKIGDGHHEFVFEWSERFGPARCGKRGEIAADPLFGERSAFWPLFDRWFQGGKLVDEFGRCVLPPEPTMVRCNGCEGRGFNRVESDRRKWCCPLCHGTGRMAEGTPSKIELRRAPPPREDE